MKKKPRKEKRVIQKLVLSSEIIRCSQCRKMLSADDFENHQCDLKLKGCKTIEVSYLQDVSYNNKKLINGWGLDGILYTFEVVPRKPIPIMLPLSDASYHDDENGREVNRTLFSILS